VRRVIFLIRRKYVERRNESPEALRKKRRISRTSWSGVGTGLLDDTRFVVDYLAHMMTIGGEENR
jgi:hypothetical protein